MRVAGFGGTIGLFMVADWIGFGGGAGLGGCDMMEGRVTMGGDGGMRT